MERKFVGVDFGAKLRPSTAITQQKKRRLVAVLCPPKKDVDVWLEAYLLDQQITDVFIDAPLSLPKIYFDAKDEKSTHHFRLADKELGAMSPMFLGGLTARAIALKSRLERLGMTFYETYPAAVLRNRFSGKTREDAITCIAEKTGLLLEDKELTAHEKDSILAWYAGFLFFQKDSKIFGREEEGCIFI